MTKRRRPAFRAVAAGDREEQRALFDGVRDADTCIDGWIVILVAGEREQTGVGRKLK